MKHKLENDYMSITVDEHGAELKSIVRKRGNIEMLWQGDAKYWKGQSPILFPTVGRSYSDTIRCNGIQYPMPKHGLVKDMDFTLVEASADTITLAVESSQDTVKCFPFSFRFIVRYHIEKNTLTIEFITENHEDVPMLFHLGAHPAFSLPAFNEQDEVHGYLGFNVRDQLISNGLKPGGYLWPEETFPVMLDKHSVMPLTNHTFDCDTILDSRGIARACTLYNIYREPLLSVHFDSPVLALWAPHGGRAPFVCIEPWWGCCDEVGYDKEFSLRRWTNIAGPKDSKTISYTITIL